MKYCEDCTSATWCYDQGKCDRAKVEVSEAALESLKAMAQRLQQERDELLHQLIVARDLVFDSREAFGPCDHSVGICNCDMDRSIADSDAIIDKCTAEPKVFE